MRVALITCRELPEPDTDEEALLGALRAAGVEAELVAWDDPDATLQGFDLAVLRSTWNYHLEPARFADWVQRVGRTARLENDPGTVAWNLHKRYLVELEAAGLPTVPTVFLERGGSASFPELLERHGWREAVIKPCISAASFRTRRFARGEFAAAQAFLDALLGERDAMVQRYLPAVEREGEKSLVWIDGEWTHAVGKRPRFQDGEESVSAALALTPRERELAERTLAALGPRARGLLYARLDLIPGDGGAPWISELELIEPSLFLVQHPPALARLVAAIERRARPVRS